MEFNWKTEAEILHGLGIAWREIARTLGKPKSTVSDYLRKQTKGYVKPSEMPVVKISGMPRILVLDIENSPSLAYVWQMFDNNLSLEQLLTRQFIITYAAKFIGEDKIYSDIISKEDCIFENDGNLIKGLIDLINQADIIVGHNVRRFDLKKVKTSALLSGYAPLLPYKVEDTLEIAKKQFKFESNKLDYIAQILGRGRKLEHSGFKLWKDFLNGDDEARRIMLEYNEQDVILTEDVYLDLRMWDNTSINKALYYDDKALRCTHCGSDDIEPIDKTVKTPSNEFIVYRCNGCKGLSRSRKGLHKKVTLTGITY